MSEKNKKEGLNIELGDDVAEGTYSNLAIINHSPSEFIIDCCCCGGISVPVMG